MRNRLSGTRVVVAAMLECMSGIRSIPARKPIPKHTTASAGNIERREEEREQERQEELRQQRAAERHAREQAEYEQQWDEEQQMPLDAQSATANPPLSRAKRKDHMMQLERQKAKLTHVNPRMEIHGDEHVRAADLKFTFDTTNDVLSEFDPALKASFIANRTATANSLISSPLAAEAALPEAWPNRMGSRNRRRDGADFLQAGQQRGSGNQDRRRFSSLR